MGMGGCLWSLVPLLILFPLFTVIREPITYILGQSTEVTQQIIDVIKANAPELFTGNAYYHQVVAASAISQYAAQIQEAIPGISQVVLEGITTNVDFLYEILENQVFEKGEADTGFLEEQMGIKG